MDNNIVQKENSVNILTETKFSQIYYVWLSTVLEKTCAITQKIRKKLFLDFEKKRKNIKKRWELNYSDH